MHYLITMKYDGSKFKGFQRLKNKPSVQKKLEDALSIINKKAVTIKGAGRTDASVHANMQCATFSLDISIDSKHLKQALNSLVKPYIYITNVYQVEDNFHARFNALKKEYIYKINMGEYNPCLEDYTFQINRPLNIAILKKCAKLFIGVHNFQNFVSGSRDNYECIIYAIKFKRKGSILEIHFIGKSFYRYMVRNLVGAMLEVEANKASLQDIQESLANPSTNKRFKTASPKGLYLHKIDY